MTNPDVVVVGAGVIGASAAYHLASRGLGVVVLERAGAPGEGSTGRATGGFRAQFTTAVNVRLSLLSREKLLAFEAETGVDPGFGQCGYLFVARDAAELAALAAAREAQRAAGFDEAVEVAPAEVARLNPALALDGVAGGVFCASDGFIRPLEILRGYAEAARRLGARFEFGVGDVEFDVRAGRVEAVRTPAGTLAPGCVVNAAGAWAALVARGAGVEVPVAPERRQVAITEPFDGLPEAMPMTIFVGDGFHLRVRDGRVLLLMPASHESEDPFDTSFDDAWLGPVVARARERVPCLAAAQIDRARCWSGLYEMSPDRHAILGPAPGVENFYLANGSSGHGVMHSPAIGHLLAEMIADGEARSVDVAALSPSRFAEGRANAAPELL
jgi:sarcosine oxidase subunit beta